jgi:hypothetical protein
MLRTWPVLSKTGAKFDSFTLLRAFEALPDLGFGTKVRETYNFILTTSFTTTPPPLFYY